jgi:hypothetical protein
MSSSLNYKYLILYVLIAVLPFNSYFIKGSVPLTSYDPLNTYSMFLYNYNKIHSTGIPPLNNLFGMGIDTASIDPAFNAYRLPNFIAYSFSNPMQGWIFLLILQYFLIGLCSFMYFRYLGLKDDIGFLCSIIYMLTPLNDEFIYQNLWGFIYLFAPILLLTLHKINDKKFDILTGALWVGLIFTLSYLSAGAMAVTYLSFGSLTYIIFVFISWKNIFHSLNKFLSIYFLGALLSIGMSSYILFPFLSEAWFMKRATVPVPGNIYSSFLQYFILLLENASSFIIPIRLDCTLRNINLVGGTELINLFDNTWPYVNIALLPALIYVLRYKSAYRRFVYLFLFIFFAVLTPPFIINFDIISVNILKCYALSKLYMFSSLAGCVLIGCFFKDILERNNKVSSLVHSMTIFYLSLIIFILVLSFILYCTGFTAAKLFLLICKSADLTNLSQIRQLLLKIITHPFRFSLIFHNFCQNWWLLCSYYLSIFAMLLMIYYRNYILKTINGFWPWIYILLVIINVNLLYNYSFPLIDKNVLSNFYSLPNHNAGTNSIRQGDRVAFYVDMSGKKLEEATERYRKNPIEEINKTVERLRRIDWKSMKDMKVYSQSYDENKYIYIRSYFYFTPYIHNGISQYSVYMHFLYPGYGQYYYNLNKNSHYFIDNEKTAGDIYKYSFLYDGFDAKAASRLGIRMVIANAPINIKNMIFIGQTSKGLYIYENYDAYPSIKLNFTSIKNNTNNGLNYLIDKYYELNRKKESVINLTILELNGEKVLTTTIPYNKHWTIFGDGHPLMISKDMNLFIGARIPSGVRTIEMKYCNNNFKIGVILSFIFCFIWLGLYFIRRFKYY